MIPIFVGCAPNHEDAESQAVLEWSIRKHTSEPVEIRWMYLSSEKSLPFTGWETSRWATPFSGFRWIVPELCGNEGHAIYCDSDFMFLADVAELWAQKPGPGQVVTGKGGAAWRLCCCLWDCAAARAYLPVIDELRRDSNTHGRLNSYFLHSELVRPFNGDWNCLDARHGEELADVKALHYTDMRTQPQLKYAIPRLAALGRSHWYDGATRPHARPDVQELFDTLLAEAADHGYTVDRYTKHRPYGPVAKRSFAGRR